MELLFIQMTYNKETITKIVLTALPSDKNIYSHLPIDKVIFLWFAGGRSGNTWELKKEGEHCFQSAEIEYWDIQLFPNGLKHAKIHPAKIMHKLRKKINCPFYIYVMPQDSEKNKKLGKSAFVRIYDDKLMVLIQLCGGIEEFVTSDIKV